MWLNSENFTLENLGYTVYTNYRYQVSCFYQKMLRNSTKQRKKAKDIDKTLNCTHNMHSKYRICYLAAKVRMNNKLFNA